MTHPPEDQLLQLLADDVAPAGRAALETHVNGCDACLTRLEALRRCSAPGTTGPPTRSSPSRAKSTFRPFEAHGPRSWMRLLAPAGAARPKAGA